MYEMTRLIPFYLLFRWKYYDTNVCCTSIKSPTVKNIENIKSNTHIYLYHNENKANMKSNIVGEGGLWDIGGMNDEN